MAGSTSGSVKAVRWLLVLKHGWLQLIRLIHPREVKLLKLDGREVEREITRSVLGFFVLMAWAGLKVLDVLEGEMLVSLTWVPVQFTQSVIPIGAILFIICEILGLPDYWRMTCLLYTSDAADE